MTGRRARSSAVVSPATPRQGPDRGRRRLARGARLVGIDSVNIDDIQGDGSRPAHSILLAAGIPVVEHLTGLGQLPPTGFLFTAAPVPLADFGTFAVRAYASVPEREVPLR